MSQPTLGDLDAIPVGLFLVDNTGRPLYANRLALETMGYHSLDEARQHQPHKFLVQVSDATAMYGHLKSGGDLRDHHVLTFSREGVLQVVCLDAKGLLDEQGYFRGVIGSFRLVSSFHHPDMWIDHVPTPTYMVQLRSDGIEVIAFCNSPYAELLGYATPTELEGMIVSQLHASPESHQTLLSALQDSQERTVVQEVELVKKSGEVIPVEVHATILRDADGSLKGRVGTLHDLTGMVTLRNELKTIGNSAGYVFHALGHTFASTQASLKAVIEWLSSPDNMIGAPDLKTQCDGLTKIVSSIRLRVAARAREIPTAQQLLSTLDREIAVLERSSSIQPQHLPSTVRVVATRLRQLLPTLRLSPLPRESIRRLKDGCEDILRTHALRVLLSTREALIQASHEERSLSERLISRARRAPKMERLSLASLVKEAVASQEEFAKLRGITVLHPPPETDGDRVKVIKVDVLRALKNIINNAIKYSWQKRGGFDDQAWIEVTVEAVGKEASCSVQNWGVPITRYEIEHGLVFGLGYRGELAAERGRPGTGIGLTDARDVADYHQGRIVVQSRPASEYDSPEDYAVPFLTVVRFFLPCARR